MLLRADILPNHPPITRGLRKVPSGPTLASAQVQVPLAQSRYPCARIYFRTIYSLRPTVLTQHPVAQKYRPLVRRSFRSSRYTRTALCPSRTPPHEPSSTSAECSTTCGRGLTRCSHRSRRMRPIERRSRPHRAFLRGFGMKTTWERHRHSVHVSPPSRPIRAFLGRRPYASQMHAGSREARRVTRPADVSRSYEAS